MAKKKVVKKTKQSEESFEDALAALEATVGELEEGRLGLAESLESYEQGVSRLKRCHRLLSEAERRVELLSGVDTEGNPVTAPFDEEAEEDLDKKQAGRSGKRTASKRPKGGVDDRGRLF